MLVELFGVDTEIKEGLGLLHNISNGKVGVGPLLKSCQVFHQYLGEHTQSQNEVQHMKEQIRDFSSAPW